MRYSNVSGLQVTINKNRLGEILVEESPFRGTPGRASLLVSKALLECQDSKLERAGEENGSEKINKIAASFDIISLASKSQNTQTENLSALKYDPAISLLRKTLCAESKNFISVPNY